VAASALAAEPAKGPAQAPAGNPPLTLSFNGLASATCLDGVGAVRLYLTEKEGIYSFVTEADGCRWQ